MNFWTVALHHRGKEATFSVAESNLELFLAGTAFCAKIALYVGILQRQMLPKPGPGRGRHRLVASALVCVKEARRKPERLLK